MPKRLRYLGITFLAMFVFGAPILAQKPEPSYPSPGAGDTPEVAGPLATDLSPALDRDAIGKAMRKVGDWQLERSRNDFNQDWTFAALYRGFLAAADSLHDDEYRDALLEVGKKFEWQLGSRKTHADDQAIGYVYLKLYRQYHDAMMLAATKAEFDRMLPLPDVCTETCPPWHDEKTPTWWWCDALFMAPPVWAELYGITKNKAYLDRMDRQWWVTSELLYDPSEHLYSRDTSFLDKHEGNGKKIFWSRGNGWVMGGIVRTLEYLPKDDPARPTYIKQLQEMAARVAQLQGPDGLWRAGLLDPGDYDEPEISGSAFFTFALAAGVNQGWLDKKVYQPVIKKAWAGMLHHVYADGRLGCIQQTGAEPAPFKASASYTYGVGAFLLAGSEIRKMDHVAGR